MGVVGRAGGAEVARARRGAEFGWLLGDVGAWKGLCMALRAGDRAGERGAISLSMPITLGYCGGSESADDHHDDCCCVGDGGYSHCCGVWDCLAGSGGGGGGGSPSEGGGYT